MSLKWIDETRGQFINIFNQYFIKDVLNIIEEYVMGFVHIGKLANDDYITINVKPNYISHQIKHFNGFSFIDFWVTESYDEGSSMFTPGWNINHYTFIYKNGILAHDIIKFLLIDDILSCRISSPIYNFKNLKNECFYFSKCSPKLIEMINLSYNDTQIGMLNLLEKFKTAFHKNGIYDIINYQAEKFDYSRFI